MQTPVENFCLNRISVKEGLVLLLELRIIHISIDTKSTLLVTKFENFQL